MPSIKTVTTAYAWSVFPAFIAAVYLTQVSWIVAGVFLVAYVLAGPTWLKCPRCRLATSSRVWKDRNGRERRSRMTHTANPDYCSRCALNFRLHSFGERFK